MSKKFTLSQWLLVTDDVFICNKQIKSEKGISYF